MKKRMQTRRLPTNLPRRAAAVLLAGALLLSAGVVGCAAEPEPALPDLPFFDADSENTRLYVGAPYMQMQYTEAMPGGYFVTQRSKYPGDTDNSTVVENYSGWMSRGHTDTDGVAGMVDSLDISAYVAAGGYLNFWLKAPAEWLAPPENGEMWVGINNDSRPEGVGSRVNIASLLDRSKAGQWQQVSIPLAAFESAAENTAWKTHANWFYLIRNAKKDCGEVQWANVFFSQEEPAPLVKQPVLEEEILPIYDTSGQTGPDAVYDGGAKGPGDT